MRLIAAGALAMIALLVAAHGAAAPSPSPPATVPLSWALGAGQTERCTEGSCPPALGRSFELFVLQRRVGDIPLFATGSISTSAVNPLTGAVISFQGRVACAWFRNGFVGFGGLVTAHSDARNVGLRFLIWARDDGVGAIDGLSPLLIDVASDCPDSPISPLGYQPVVSGQITVNKGSSPGPF